MKYSYRLLRKKNKKSSKKRFTILTFEERKFTPKQSLHDFSKQFMKRTNNSFEKYQDELKNEEIKKYYQNLKNTLIESYNVECETLTEPNRKDEIYKNIEIPYKHTYSLAYEMAIRNPKVKKILYALNYLKSIEKNVHKNFKNNKTFTEKIEDYRETLYSEYQHYINVEFHEKYLSLQFDVIDKLINDFEDELNKKYLIVPKENIIKTPESNRILVQRAINNSFHPNKNIDEEIEYKFDEKIYDDYTISIGAFVGNDQFDVNVIRPTFNSHIIDTNSFYIPINFTLPTDEIVAFIKKIKNDSQINEKLIKSPIELLEKELEVIDSVNTEKHFPKKFKNKLKTMANALFAYDKFNYLSESQKKLKYRKDKLQEELNNKKKKYIRTGRRTKCQKININKIEIKYNEKIIKLDEEINKIDNPPKTKFKTISKELGLSIVVIERYISFMNGYIEEEKYKKLFTKTKIK